MDGLVEKNTLSASLLARDVYGVCFTERDSADVFQGEFSKAREAFYTGGKKTVRVGQKEVVKGFDGTLRGKLSRHTMYWKKTANKVALEETFDQKSGPLLVFRDFRGMITGRMYFDKSMIWVKSEYYNPGEKNNAAVIFKPCSTADQVERFDYLPEKQRYRSTMLYALPYEQGSARQSFANAKFGQPSLIVSTGEGVFCYTPKEEMEERKKLMEGSLEDAVSQVMEEEREPVKEDEEETIQFSSLEQYAVIEKASPAAVEGTEKDSAAAEKEPDKIEADSKTEEKVPKNDASETTEEDIPAAAAEQKTTEAERQEILEAAREAVKQEKEEASSEKKEEEEAFDGQGEEGASLSSEDGVSYQGSIENGRISGRGRSEQANGMTAYDGEYQDGKRNGFGSYYYRDGNLCYAGFWKDDKKHGLGVSFRRTDHALHISQWNQGKPEGFTLLLDKDGGLRFAGQMQCGKKQGAGVRFSKEDGSVFVEKWKDGQPTGEGALFDKDGNLLYTGMWKDGKKNGKGTAFDPQGEVVFSGEWKEDAFGTGVLYKKMTQSQLEETKKNSKGS